MLIQDPYKTKALKPFSIDKIKANLERYILIDWPYLEKKSREKLLPINDEKTILNPVLLYGLSHTEEDIDPFFHAIINLDKKYSAIDLRQVVKADRANMSYDIRNEAEYLHRIHRLILSSVFATEKYDSLASFILAQKAFASWLSDNLMKRFGLNLGEYNLIYILALIYYHQLFTNDPVTKSPQELFTKIRAHIFVPELFHEVFKKINKLDTIDDFCAHLYPVTNNPRLKDLDYTILSNLLINNWYGLNAKELILVSLEHPPTWIALVHIALTQKSFKNSMISTIVEKAAKKGVGEEFLRQFSIFIKNYRSVNE